MAAVRTTNSVGAPRRLPGTACPVTCFSLPCTQRRAAVPLVNRVIAPRTTICAHRRWPSRDSSACKASLADVEDDDSDDDYDPNEIDDRIPITVITGFLGSGKTTLLNNILTQNHGQRIAVIENEVGEIDVDSELVASAQQLEGREDIIMMLNNGCLCCTVRDDLIGMLKELAGRRSEFDRIVIETTGLANPAPIIQTFFMEPDIAELVVLDGVVTLVDAKHVGQHLDEEKPEGVVNEALQQIAYADRIVLNKIDLVSAEQLQDLEARLKTINSLAQVVRAERAAVGVEYVLGVGGFDLERVEAEINPDLLKKESTSSSHEHDHEHEHAHESEHEHSHAHSTVEAEGGHSHSHDDHSHGHSHEGHDHSHKHDDSVASVSVLLDGDMDLEKVNFWLGSLIQMRGEDLFRMKGVIAIHDFPETFVFQGVHSIFEGMPGRPWKEGEKRASRMVFIGRNLDAELLKEGFQACLTENDVEAVAV